MVSGDQVDGGGCDYIRVSISTPFLDKGSCFFAAVDDLIFKKLCIDLFFFLVVDLNLHQTSKPFPLLPLSAVVD